MAGVEMAGQMQSGSSADFVRKLYNMLEDHRNQNIVRWGNDGDTFVVLETEAFTRSVLPKHFKHGNFASFVRQLNKYDFHKVKRAEDGMPSPYGPNASEFKHPNFKANRVGDLENIRRKGPNPMSRKTMPGDPALQSIAMVNDQANATQAQVQQLQEKMREMAQSKHALMEEVRELHKIIRAQQQSQQGMLNYLTYFRRDNQVSSHSAASSAGSLKPEDSPTDLRQAREFLVQADRDLDRMSALHGASFGPMFGTPGSLGVDDPLIDITKYPVYPAGQSIGIDPFHSDHINNVPYPLPASMQEAVYAAVQTTPTPTPPQPPIQPASVVSAAPPTPSASAAAPVSVAPSVAGATAAVQVSTPGLSPFLEKSPWGKRKPRILLAEDDPTCSRIGAKFLNMIDCNVEIAMDGIGAFTLINTAAGEFIDLILMDIVMPHMDGVSATAKIRQMSQIPIIAMTSNVKPDEVQMYVEAGMNGILPKPFTLDRMLNALKAHLPHLLDGYVPDSDMSFGMGGYNAGVGSLGNAPLASPLDGPGSSVLTGGGIVKFESTPPAHSPSATTSTSWHSPGGYAQPSPTTTHGTMDLATSGNFPVGLNGNGQLLATTPGGFSADMPPPGSGGSGIMEERAAKRSKLHAGQSAGHGMGFAQRPTLHDERG